MISMIVAVDEKKGMGYQNGLLCHIPKDLLWFQKRTKGKPVIMGRNTAVSLKNPLPRRKNIVLSSSGWTGEGFSVCKTPEEALSLAYRFIETEAPVNPGLSKTLNPHHGNTSTLDCWEFENPEKEIMIIGGAQIYKEFLGKADCLDITHIHAQYQADVFFPPSDDFFLYDSHFFADDAGSSPNFTIARYRKRG